MEKDNLINLLSGAAALGLVSPDTMLPEDEQALGYILQDAGLGAMVVNTSGKLAVKPEMKKMAAQIQNRALVETAKRSTISHNKMAMIAHLPKAAPEFKDKVATGKMKYKDMVWYKRAAITLASGIQTFWDQTNEMAAGLSNLQEDHLFKGDWMLIRGLRMSYGTSASITDARQASFYTFDEPHVNLLNAEVEFKLGGKGLFPPRPVRDFFAFEGGSIQTSISNKDNTVWLSEPEPWDDNQRLEVLIRIPNGLTTATNNHFLSLDIIGPGLQSR